METTNQTTTASKTDFEDYPAIWAARVPPRTTPSCTSVIESCKLNDMDPGKYLRHLLNKLKSHKEGDDLRNLLPCYCILL